VPVLESTAFARMSQDRFQDYFDKAKVLWFSEVVPQAEGEALLAEIEAMLGNPPLNSDPRK
jgi:hypothetical protein